MRISGSDWACIINLNHLQEKRKKTDSLWGSLSPRSLCVAHNVYRFFPAENYSYSTSQHLLIGLFPNTQQLRLDTKRTAVTLLVNWIFEGFVVQNVKNTWGSLARCMSRHSAQTPKKNPSINLTSVSQIWGRVGWNFYCYQISDSSDDIYSSLFSICRIISHYLIIHTIKLEFNAQCT